MINAQVSNKPWTAHYESLICSLFILSIALILFTPVASIAMIVCGVLALGLVSKWGELEEIFISPIGLSTIALIILMSIHLLDSNIALHGTIKAYTRWLIFIPFLSMAVLLRDPIWQKRAVNAIIFSSAASAFFAALYQLSLAGPVSPILHSMSQHVPLLQTLMIKCRTHNLQERATLYALVSALAYARAIDA